MTRTNASEGRPDGKLRMAAVGGTRGANVIQNWQRWELADAVAFCDLRLPVAERAAAASEREGFARPRVFDDLARMLDWGEFDGVFIGTSDASHHAVAKQVIERGFPCVIEKPMTVTAEEARELVDLAQATGTIVMVGHEFRHVPAMREAKRRLDAGEIGTPRMAITLDYCGRMGSYWRRHRWRKGTRSPENSLTLSKAIHQLDVQCMLMGSPVAKVYATAGEDHYGDNYPSGLRAPDGSIPRDSLYHPDQPLLINGIANEKAKQDNLPVFADDTDLHDNQVVALDYASGARGSYVECFFTPDYRYEHTIIGDLGRLMLRAVPTDNFTELETHRTGTTRRCIERIPGLGAHSGGDHGLAKAFVEAVHRGEAIEPTVVDGWRAVVLCKAIDQSAATGEPVQLTDHAPVP